MVHLINPDEKLKENIDKGFSKIIHKERLKRISIESIDFADDPYFIRLNAYKIICKLCQTHHRSESSYLAHLHGKRHSQNLLKVTNVKNHNKILPVSNMSIDSSPKKSYSRPGYTVLKSLVRKTMQKVIFIELFYNLLQFGETPDFRIMTTFEQKIESLDFNYQYIVCAAPNYESIAFKVPNCPIDNYSDYTYSYWNINNKKFYISICFK